MLFIILHFYDIPLLIGEKPLNCKITATRLIDKIFCNIIVFPLILFISHPEIVILIFRNIYYTPLRNPKIPLPRKYIIPLSRKDEFTLSRKEIIPKKNKKQRKFNLALLFSLGNGCLLFLFFFVPHAAASERHIFRIENIV